MDDDGCMRVCAWCDRPLDPAAGGMTVDGGGWYCHEGCFKPLMDRDYGPGNWSRTDDDDGLGGFYLVREGGGWEPTGIFWTTWEDGE